MRKLRASLPVILAVIATWGVTTATAQSEVPVWTFVRDSGGQVWLVGTTSRLAVPIYPATDEQIAAIAWNGNWVVPSGDNSSVVAGAKPSWATDDPRVSAATESAPAVAAAPVATATPTPAPAPAPSAQETIKLSGERGENTKPFTLKSGNYTVSWKTELRRDSSSCFSGATLYRVEGKRYIESLYSLTLKREGGDRSASGDTEVYGITAGQYYLDVTTTACSWSVEIKPQ